MNRSEPGIYKINGWSIKRHGIQEITLYTNLRKKYLFDSQKITSHDLNYRSRKQLLMLNSSDNINHSLSFIIII